MEKQVLPLENELNLYPFPAVAVNDTLTVFRCNIAARATFGGIPALKRILKQVGAQGVQLFSWQTGDASFLVTCARWEKRGMQGPLFFFLEDPLSAFSFLQNQDLIEDFPCVIFPQSTRPVALSSALLRVAHEERLRKEKERFATFFALRKTEEKTVQTLRLDTFFDSLLPLMKTMFTTCRITCAPSLFVRTLPDVFCQMILYVLAFFRQMGSDRLSVSVRPQGDLTVVTLRATDPQGICAGWKEVFFDRQDLSKQEGDALLFSPLLFAGLCAMRERVKMTVFSESKEATVHLSFSSAPPEKASFFSVPMPSLSALFWELVRQWSPLSLRVDEKDKKLM